MTDTDGPAVNAYQKADQEGELRLVLAEGTIDETQASGRFMTARKTVSVRR